MSSSKASGPSSLNATPNKKQSRGGGKNDCLVCENYVRKIKEIQQTISGRDIIIEMLQKQIKKCEHNYKNLLEDYEQLRYRYCTTDYELTSLKDINEKLEKIGGLCRCKTEAKHASDASYVSRDKLQDELENCKKECQRLRSKLNQIEDNGHTQFGKPEKPKCLQNAINIENLINNQNAAIRKLLGKVLDEIKNVRGDPSAIENEIQELNNINEKIRLSSDSMNDKDKKIKELDEEVKKLKKQLQAAKEQVGDLTGSSSKSGQLETLQDKIKLKNIEIQDLRSKLNGLPELKLDESPKDTCCKEQQTDISQNIKELMKQLGNLKNKISQLLERESRLMRQLEQAEQSNNALSDTLVIVTEENKHNLDKISQLSDQLKKATQEADEWTCKCNGKINCLSSEIEEQRSKELELKTSLIRSEAESEELKTSIKGLIDENKKLKAYRDSLSSEQSASLLKEIESSKNITDDLNKQIRDLQRKLKKQDDDMETYKNKCVLLEKQLDDLQKNYKDFKSSVSPIRDREKRVQRDLSKTKKSPDARPHRGDSPSITKNFPESGGNLPNDEQGQKRSSKDGASRRREERKKQPGKPKVDVAVQTDPTDDSETGISTERHKTKKVNKRIQSDSRIRRSLNKSVKPRKPLDKRSPGERKADEKVPVTVHSQESETDSPDRSGKNLIYYAQPGKDATEQTTIPEDNEFDTKIDKLSPSSEKIPITRDFSIQTDSIQDNIGSLLEENKDLEDTQGSEPIITNQNDQTEFNSELPQNEKSETNVRNTSTFDNISMQSDLTSYNFRSSISEAKKKDNQMHTSMFSETSEVSYIKQPSAIMPDYDEIISDITDTSSYKDILEEVHLYNEIINPEISVDDKSKIPRYESNIIALKSKSSLTNMRSDSELREPIEIKPLDDIDSKSELSKIKEDAENDSTERPGSQHDDKNPVSGKKSCCDKKDKEKKDADQKVSDSINDPTEIPVSNSSAKTKPTNENEENLMTINESNEIIPEDVRNVPLDEDPTTHNNATDITSNEENMNVEKSGSQNDNTVMQSPLVQDMSTTDKGGNEKSVNNKSKIYMKPLPKTFYLMLLNDPTTKVTDSEGSMDSGTNTQASLDRLPPDNYKIPSEENLQTSAIHVDENTNLTSEGSSAASARNLNENNNTKIQENLTVSSREQQKIPSEQTMIPTLENNSATSTGNLNGNNEISTQENLVGSSREQDSEIETQNATKRNLISRMMGNVWEFINNLTGSREDSKNLEDDNLKESSKEYELLVTDKSAEVVENEPEANALKFTQLTNPSIIKTSQSTSREANEIPTNPTASSTRNKTEVNPIIDESENDAQYDKIPPHDTEPTNPRDDETEPRGDSNLEVALISKSTEEESIGASEVSAPTQNSETESQTFSTSTSDSLSLRDSAVQTSPQDLLTDLDSDLDAKEDRSEKLVLNDSSVQIRPPDGDTIINEGVLVVSSAVSANPELILSIDYSQISSIESEDSDTKERQPPVKKYSDRTRQTGPRPKESSESTLQLQESQEKNAKPSESCGKKTVDKQLVTCKTIIGDMQDTINKQKKELAGLQKENQNYKDQILMMERKNTEEMERLGKEILKSQNNIDALLKEHDEKNAHFKAVCKEVEKLKETIDEENEKYQSHVKSLEDENSRLKADIHDVLGTCSKLGSEVEKLKAENSKKQTIIDELENTVDNSKDILEECEKKVKALVKENESLRYNERELERKVQDASLDIGKLKEAVASTVADAENNIRKTEEENAKLRQKLKDMRDEIKYMEEKCLEHCKQLTNEKRRSSVESEKAQAAISDNANLTDKYRRLQKDYNDLSSENRKLKDDLEKYANHVDLVEREAQKLSNKAEGEKQELSRKLRNSIDKNEYDIIKKKYDRLLSDYERQTQELEDTKKKFEVCCQASQLNRDEYNNLKREYKDIKSMLKEQIQKYKTEAAPDIDAKISKPHICNQLKHKLLEKEKEIQNLQTKLHNASIEIIELKDQIHKLVSDYRILKNSINNLIADLERKLRGTSIGDRIENTSAESIADEILISLSNIESKILRKSSSCPIKECDCISKIRSSTDNAKLLCDQIIGPTASKNLVSCDCAERDTTNNGVNVSSTDSEEFDGSTVQLQKLKDELEKMNHTINIEFCGPSSCPHMHHTSSNH